MRTPRRRRRGFTLLEVTISVIFTGIFILMAIGWITALMGTGASILSQNTSASDLSYLSTTFGNDAASAVVCDPNGLGVPLYSFSSTALGLYEPDTSTSGQIDLVLWQYVGGAVERAVVAPSAGTSCTYDTSSPTWVTVASNVSSLQFVPWYQGSAGVAPATATSGGSCAGATGSVNAPDNCLFDSIELKVTELGVAQGNNQSEPSSMDQTFSVSLANSKLV